MCVCVSAMYIHIHVLIGWLVDIRVQAYAIIDEMVGNGWVIDSNKSSILAPLKLMEKSGSVAS